VLKGGGRATSTCSHPEGHPWTPTYHRRGSVFGNQAIGRFRAAWCGHRARAPAYSIIPIAPRRSAKFDCQLHLSFCRGLLGSHENEPAMMHWKQNSAAHHRAHRRRLCFFTATFLAVSSICFFTYLQWQYAYGVPQRMPAESFSHLAPAEPKNDLKLLLHPDAHVSRAPSVRQYSWNVTKARIAPDGVEKDVFLINGMDTCSHAMHPREN
jgi:hypothetical protein